MAILCATSAVGGILPTTTVVTSSANPSTYGSGVTFTATVTPSLATGHVTFFEGVTPLVTLRLSGGQALLFTTQLPSGTGLLRAYYTGDANYSPSTSATLSQTVRALPGLFQSPVNIAPAASISNYGGPFVFGDFNGDGKSDIALGGVGVLLGNGDGTFQQPLNYAVGHCFFPRLVATADFNGDGKADLAVGESCSGVDILLGNGDGTFQPPVSYGDGGGLPYIAVGDFNGDGKTDLVLADTCYGGVCRGIASILYGNGDGTFHSGPNYGLTGTVSVGDFNGDGRADLVTGGGVLLGNGDGTFQPVKYFGPISNACLAACGVDAFAALPIINDINGDGKADLVIPDQSGSTVSVLLGKGDGTFQPSTSYGVGPAPQSITVGDFDGDGRSDLAVACSNGVNVLFGNGDGTFRGPSNAPGSPVRYVGVGPVRNDGRADIVFLTETNIGVLLNTAPTPDLTITKSHVGNFTQGQNGAVYVLTVSNIGTAATAGSVMVTDVLPVGLPIAGMAGAGWNCIVTAATCTRSDSLVSGSTYPNITVTVNVPANAPTIVINTATVSGGGEVNRANNTAVDPAQINVAASAQTITFPTPSDQTIGGPPVTLVATASSGLAVSFNSTTNSICTVSGAMVTLVGVGTCSITATQGGNAKYAPAAPVARSFAVRYPQTVIFGPLPNVTLATPPFSVSATASSGLPVSFTSVTPTVCRVSGNLVSDIAAGVCSIIAAQPGDASFAAAAPVTQSFSVIGPVINPGGVVPLFSSVNVISPGSWFSIYGTNLVSNSAAWDGNFENASSLNGVSVTLNGKSAYISSVTRGSAANPDQINAEAPDDQTTGPVAVTVTNSLGRAVSTVNLAPFAPSFSLLDTKHVAGIILTPDGTGAYGNGGYDIVGPVGAFPYATRPVRAGETLILYGVGFGPTSPPVPAGVLFSGAATAINQITLTIGGVSVQPTFAGISYTGQYQLNLVVPSVSRGDQALVATVAGVQSPSQVVVTVQ